jgi:DNA polymerase III subunit gamma/tau
MAWYNKYRPTNFEEVIGQQLVKTVLQNTIKLGKIKHGYLLTGPKGVGKTTIARIFANQINGFGSNSNFGSDESSSNSQLDIIELDAASNTGVDNIRQLIESAQTPPFEGNYKVFIIDEVHMLSKSAMNAMLKILEEPPSYLVFLLATTNPEKIIPTVLSRLTVLPLTSHSVEDLVESLERICSAEKLSFDTKSLELIAKRAGGGQRDAINLLETLSSYELGTYTLENVVNILGLVSDDTLELLSQTLLSQNTAQLQQVMQELSKSSIDGEGFLGEYLDYLLSKAILFDSNYDSVITALAEVLSYKLPITTIPSAIALLQVSLRRILGESSISLPKSQPPVNPKIDIPDSSPKKKVSLDSGKGLESNSVLETTPSIEESLEKNILHKGVNEDFDIIKETTPSTFGVHPSKEGNSVPSSLTNSSNEENLAPNDLLDDQNEEFISKPKAPRLSSQPAPHEGNPVLSVLANVYEEGNPVPSSLTNSSNEGNSMPSDLEVNPKVDSVSSFENPNKIDFSSKIKELQTSSSVPPMLKVSTKGLEELGYENGVLTMTTSNPFFKPQLEQPKNKEFLVNFFGVKSIVITSNSSTTKSTTTVPTGTFSNDADDNFGSNFEGFDDQELGSTVSSPPATLTQKTETKPKKVSTKSKNNKSTEKIFYELYSPLPENTIGDMNSIPTTNLTLEDLIPRRSPENDSTTFGSSSDSFDSHSKVNDWESAVDSFFNL